MEQTTAVIKVNIEPRAVRLASLWAGIISGGLMVALDPWLRFPSYHARINWQETLITAALMAGYGFVLSLLFTTFWRTKMLWVSVVLTTPLIAVFVAIWNDLTTAFGTPSNILLFLPVTLVIHGVMVAMVQIYLEIGLRLQWRRTMALMAIPVVLFLMSFLVLGRLRWASQDAKDVMHAVNNYASQTVNGEYSIEYQGIRYNTGLASVGQARIYTDNGTFQCEARLFQNAIDVACEED
ncbi:MAG: hypothetical protein KJ064_24745 [Anaerolineae bacterium]|nr:hypothetical protein [Anaerolineae bacterium]